MCRSSHLSMDKGFKNLSKICYGAQSFDKQVEIPTVGRKDGRNDRKATSCQDPCTLYMGPAKIY